MQPQRARATAFLRRPSENVDETLLAALAALFGLGGAAGILAFRRRRANRDDAVEAIEPAAALPLAMHEPVRHEPRTAPRAAAVRQRMPLVSADSTKVRPTATGSLVEKIDFSKPAGYYEASVDQAPSPENPFLTRTKRLSRARFLDRQLRLAEDRHLSKSPPCTPQIGRRVRKPELA